MNFIINSLFQTCDNKLSGVLAKIVSINSFIILLIQFFSLKTSQANRMPIKYHLKIESSQSLRTNWTINCFSFTEKNPLKISQVNIFLSDNFLAFQIQSEHLLWIYAFFNVSRISVGIKFIYSIYFYDSINPQRHKRDFFSSK